MTTPHPAAPDPPKRGRGQPRITDVRITASVTQEVLDDVDAAAAERGTTRSAEIRRRLTAGSTRKAPGA